MSRPPAQRTEIVPYDPRWPGLAEGAIGELRGALGGVVGEIEHIGSTAVPGLAAKPVIDLMGAAEELEAVERRGAVLAGLGYVPLDPGMPERLLFVRQADGRRTHHFHVVTAASWPHRAQRLFRDHLRAHPEDATRYALLKRRIAEAGSDPDAYTEAKTELVQELTDRARAERGLPPASVWEG
ncbi:GrpB family protein [Streptomyces sp. NPDC060194]|uniref:GrpB family protein n=1 Tax=Streptomyces sp. NPDC060194 TaxID=3347069 RepID=UPI00364C021A